MKRLILLLAVLLVAVPAHAATYYVSKSGSDANSCATAQSTTLANEKLTINGGIGCLSAGDTLLVRVGSYNEGITSVPSGTSWSNKTRIAAFPGDTVTMAPASNATSAGGIGYVIWLDCTCHYIEFDGLNLDGSNLTGGVYWTSTNNGNDVHHIRYQNGTVIGCACGGGGAMLLGSHSMFGQTGSSEILNTIIHGGGLTGSCGFMCAEYGIYIASPNNLVDGVEIYDTSGEFIQLYGGGGEEPTGNIIRNSRLHDMTRMGDATQIWGILVDGSNNQIYNNLIYGINVGNVATNNAAIVATLTGNKIWNNTIYNNKSNGITLDSNAVNTVIQNNIIYLSGNNNYDPNGASGTTQDHNLFGSDPSFQNAASANFHLTSSSSAIDQGVSESGTFTTDLDAVARPQGLGWDIGAYEYIPGGGGGSGSSAGGGPGKLTFRGKR